MLTFINHDPLSYLNTGIKQYSIKQSDFVQYFYQKEANDPLFSQSPLQQTENRDVIENK